MADPRHSSEQPTQARVALVLFQVADYRVALEARHVLSMTDHPNAPRTAAAQALLYEAPLCETSPPPPTSWLTLRDAQGQWQLGVNGEITLQQLPAASLYPLPALLAARRFSPALCGFAFDRSQSQLQFQLQSQQQSQLQFQQQLVLLLDARKLAPIC